MKGIQNLGIGLRDEFAYDIINSDLKASWLEIIPENYFKIARKHRDIFHKIIDNYPIVCHGVSLSIASDRGDISEDFLISMRNFLDKYNFLHYSEHFSFCHFHNKQSYELLPPPLNYKSIKTIVENIDFVQNFLNRELILENASWYYSIDNELKESDFINEICKQSGAKMIMDVNNVYVNATNHNFSAKDFILDINKDNIAYYHIAGHLKKNNGQLIDTHGSKVKDEVLSLLELALKRKKSPVLLERDNNIPPFKTLTKEFDRIKKVVDSI